MSVTFYAYHLVGDCWDWLGDEEVNSLQLSNGNMAQCVHPIIDPKGEHEYYSGMMCPGKALARLDGMLDSSTLTSETKQVGRVIYCGRSEGQVEHYLSKLKQLCELAIKHDGMLGWG